MVKCSKCGIDFEHYGQKHNWCRKCKNEYDRNWYRNQSDEKKKRITQQKAERLRKLAERFNKWKGEQGCLCCDESEPCALDLHHTNPEEKESSLSDAIYNGWSWENIMTEASKCVIVCRNCHAKIHEGIIKLG